MIRIRKHAKPVILSRPQMNVLIDTLNAATSFIFVDEDHEYNILTIRALVEKGLMVKSKKIKDAYKLTKRGYNLTEEYLARRSTSPIRIKE